LAKCRANIPICNAIQYRFLSASEVPPFADWGAEYETISLHPNVYLNYLQSTCISKGAKFRRQTLSHIREAFFLHSVSSHKADLVVNCCGVSAATLGGVLDEAVKPKRGQLVIVENKSGGIFSLSGKDDDAVEGIGESTYIINRPGGKFICQYIDFSQAIILQPIHSSSFI
jgi:glycine/D-amino acid oxidase-like deaminating enzyme